MRHVMVMNSKGGCGKSTLATNLASYFATEGYKVALADYDPQRTSLDWLAMRPEDLPKITGVAAYDEGLRGVPRDTEVLVIDAPARTHGSEMNELVRRAETILVPVLPSPIDMKACAHFMGELLELGKVQREQARLARRGESGAREHAHVRGAGPVPGQAQGAVPDLAAAVDQLPARVPARHGDLRAAGIPGVAGLEAVGADHEVAGEQEEQSS